MALPRCARGRERSRPSAKQDDVAQLAVGVIEASVKSVYASHCRWSPARNRNASQLATVGVARDHAHANALALLPRALPLTDVDTVCRRVVGDGVPARATTTLRGPAQTCWPLVGVERAHAVRGFTGSPKPMATIP